jgi:hypothetical protein
MGRYTSLVASVAPPAVTPDPRPEPPAAAAPIVPLYDLITLVERTFPGASFIGVRPRGSGREDA